MKSWCFFLVETNIRSLSYINIFCNVYDYDVISLWVACYLHWDMQVAITVKVFPLSSASLWSLERNAAGVTTTSKMRHYIRPCFDFASDSFKVWGQAETSIQPVFAHVKNIKNLKLCTIKTESNEITLFDWIWNGIIPLPALSCYCWEGSLGRQKSMWHNECEN